MLSMYFLLLSLYFQILDDFCNLIFIIIIVGHTKLTKTLSRLRDVTASAHADDEESLCDTKLVELFSVTK